MRISDISAWAECETRALHSPPMTAGRQNIASHVGTMAHAKLAGVALELPGRLAFDTLTPSMHHANVQSDAIAHEARRLLLERQWAILGQEEALRRDELTGHLDIRAWHSDFGEAVIDLKTGMIGAAWLQVGGYLMLLDEDTAVRWGGVLHVPRVKVSKDVTGTLELRDAYQLAVAWSISSHRILDVMNGAKPTYSPGMHCGRCRVPDCPVRIGDKP